MIGGTRHNIPVYELSEWKTLIIEGMSLSETDRRLAAELAGGEAGRLVVEELRSGVQVSASSWVGVARFEQFELRVIPKLAGGNLGLVEMIEFATGLDALRRSSGARTLATEGGSLFDLIALLLAESCERLARGGLLADYVEAEGELPAVRGRLLGDRQVLKRFGQIDRVICRWDELVQDVVENQLLAAALEKCARRVTDDTVRLRVGRLRALFSEVCSPEKLDQEVARQRLIYHRLNAHYRNPHELAWLVLEGLRAVEDVFISGRSRCFTFLIDMNQLFERFVYRLVEKLLEETPWKVKYQRVDRSIIWNADKSQPYSRVIPDLLIEPRGAAHAALAIDAKYKLYDERKISPGDVYQSFLYAYAYGSGDVKGSLPRSLIIYPASRGSAGSTRLRVQSAKRLAGAEIFAMGLPISDCLFELRQLSLGSITTTLMGVVAGAMEGRSNR